MSVTGEQEDVRLWEGKVVYDYKRIYRQSHAHLEGPVGIGLVIGGIGVVIGAEVLLTKGTGPEEELDTSTGALKVPS